MSRLRVASLVWTPFCIVALALCVANLDAGTPPRITDLGGVAGYSTTARGINEAGEIVGEQYRSMDADTRESHGWIWRKNATGQYFSTEIGELADFPNSYPRGINNSGRVAGWAEGDPRTWAPPAQVVMWDKDGSGGYVPADLGTPYGFWYSETANFGDGGHVLNEHGQIAGGVVFPSSWQHYAHLWTDPGLFAPIDLGPSVDGTDRMAYGVDDAGFVVGKAQGNSPTGFFQNAVLWQKSDAGDYSEVELPMPAGAQRATAFDINDRGQIVGIASSSSSTSAVIWEKNATSGHYEPHYLELPPGATLSSANAINNSGNVVGWAVVSNAGGTIRHALLWQEGQSGTFVPTDLGTLPGGATSEACGINELGQVVGASTYWDETAQTTVLHAVLWDVADVTPPEIAEAR